MRAHTCLRLWLCVILATTPCTWTRADSPRTKAQLPAQVGDRMVRELVVTAPIHVGHPLGPGAPTVPQFSIAPGRFLPVSQDQESVYFQAVGTFAQGSSDRGGLRVTKGVPRYVFVYQGDATYQKMPLLGGDVLSTADIQKIRVVFADSKTPQKPPKKP